MRPTDGDVCGEESGNCVRSNVCESPKFGTAGPSRNSGRSDQYADRAQQVLGGLGQCAADEQRSAAVFTEQLCATGVSTCGATVAAKRRGRPPGSKSAPSKIRQSQESPSEKHPSASGEAEKHEVATEDGSTEQVGAKRSRLAEANELIEVDECARLCVDDV